MIEVNSEDLPIASEKDAFCVTIIISKSYLKYIGIVVAIFFLS